MRAKTAYAVLAAAALAFAAALSQSAADQQEPPPAGTEQPSDVTLELRRDQAQAMRLAIPAFRLAPGMPADAVAAARQLEATVRQDLELSGYFVIQGPQDFAALSLTGDPAQDVEQYRSVGSQILIVGDLRAEGDRIVFEGRLFDVASGRTILAKRYRGAFTAARRIGHTFADDVIAHLIGGRGIGLTSIAFASTRAGH